MSALPVEPYEPRRRYQAAAEEWARENPLPDLTPEQRALLLRLLQKLR